MGYHRALQWLLAIAAGLLITVLFAAGLMKMLITLGGG